MIRYVLAGSLLVGLFLLGTDRFLAGDPKGGPLKLRFENGNVTWSDYQGEATYRVSVRISYLPPPTCGPGGLHIDGETVEAMEELPADTTSFSLPQRTDPRLTWPKEMSISVQAIDAAGGVLASDGFNSTADKFCTPEEIAAAGTGFSSAQDLNGRLFAASLAALGTLCLAGGVGLRRKGA